MEKNENKNLEMLANDFPEFAKAFIALNLAVIEAAHSGSSKLSKRMCEMLASKLPIMFRNHWKKSCDSDPPGILSTAVTSLEACLEQPERNYDDCYDEFISKLPPLIPGLEEPVKPWIDPIKRMGTKGLIKVLKNTLKGFN